MRLEQRVIFDPLHHQVGNYPEVTCANICYHQVRISDVVRVHSPRADSSIDVSKIVFPGAPDFKPV